MPTHSFTDCQGRVFTPRLTLGRIIEFESMTGRNLMNEIYVLVKEARKGEMFKGAGELEAAVTVIRYIFPDLKSMALFLFALVEPKARKEYPDITFPDFADSIEPGQAKELIDALATHVTDFTRDLVRNISGA